MLENLAALMAKAETLQDASEPMEYITPGWSDYQGIEWRVYFTEPVTHARMYFSAPTI
jgi:hypothetical protein